MRFLVITLVLMGCFKPPTWSVDVLRQGDEILVKLHHNDYPRGPSRLTLDGKPLEVATRGGTTPTFLLGPGGFGPTWRRTEPTYRLPLPRAEPLPAPVVLEFEGARVIMELETRRFMLVAPGAAVRPGDELTIHFEPGPDVVVLPTHWGGLHAQFTPTGGKPAPWTLRGGPRKVLHPQVPQTAAPGPGELIIAGVMPAAVTTCDGVAGCNASVVVNTVIPLDIVP